jgi:UDP-N-acetylmuramate dehydrogenase
MALPQATLTALRDVALHPQLDVPLLKKTWWRAGGPADGFVTASSIEDLANLQRICRQTDCPVFVLGNASNLLVGDGGIRGIVVRLAGDLSRETPDDQDPLLLSLGGGLKLIPFVNRMLKRGWTGLELFAGIPGTIGGAIRMNAGTAIGETVDALVDVDLVYPDGRIARVTANSLNMRYRHAELPEGAIVASARFKTTGADPAESRRHVEAHLAYRARTQPVDVPTCGSTFRNPEGDTAGRLIDAAGLKGHRIGGAEVSRKHANFVVNTGGASARDIRALVQHIQRVVRDRFDVELHREVHFVGDWLDA